MTRRALPSRVLFLADSTHAQDLPELVRTAAGAGIRFIELRRPGVHGSALRLQEARQVRSAAPGATLLVNDRPDVAMLCGADGVHLGQDDLPVAPARRLMGEGALIGLSTHDAAQLGAARSEPVDYVAVGPIFESSTKSGHAAVLGLAALRRLRRMTDRPLVAIGGIGPESAPDVLDAGADCVAVASAIASGDVAANARRFLRAVGEAGPQRPWILAGLSGSGKTTVGARLAALSSRRFVDLDEAVGAVRVLQLLREGEAALRAEERRILQQELSGDGALVLALGGGTLLDPEARRAVRSAGILAWLEAPLAACLERVAAAGQAPRPLLAAARTAGEASLREHAARRRSAASSAEVVVDASAPPEEVARNLLQRLLDAEGKR